MTGLPDFSRGLTAGCGARAARSHAARKRSGAMNEAASQPLRPEVPPHALVLFQDPVGIGHGLARLEDLVGPGISSGATSTARFSASLTHRATRTSEPRAAQTGPRTSPRAATAAPGSWSAPPHRAPTCGPP